MLLSSRSKEIIVYLAQQKDYVTYEEIGKQLGVSSRTVIREISTVEEWLVKKDIELIKKSRYGIKIDCTDEQKEQLISELSSVKVYKAYTSKERQDIMLLDLLQSDEEQKQYYFSSLLGVSDATISQDLHKLDERLKEHNITIQRKSGLGIKLVGTETDKRQMLLNVFYSHLSKKQVLNIIRKDIYSDTTSITADSQAVQRLLYLISPEKLAELETIVNRVINEHNYPLADSSKLGLIVHLVLAVERVKNSENITMHSDIFDELKSSDEYTVAKAILSAIEEEYELDMPDAESGYITMHIKGSRLKDFAKGKFERELPNFDVVKVANQIVDNAENATGKKLNKDRQLFNGLMVHLKPMLIRMKMGLEIRNPLLQDIKMRYPGYFDLAKRCQKPLEDYLGHSIPEEETGFICMHIGAAVERLKRTENRKPRAIVTCPTGMGTSKMLAVSLKHEVPEIEVVDILSVMQIKDERLKQSRADIIISTVDLNRKDLPVVVVSPMLSERDINRLKNKLVTLPISDYSDYQEDVQEADHANETSQAELLEQIKLKNEYGLAIKNVLDNTCIYTSSKDSVEDALMEYIERSFEKKNWKTVFNQLMERESLGNIIFEKYEMVFFHNKIDGIEGLYSSAVNLNTNLEYKGKQINTLIILLAPKNATSVEVDVIGEYSRQLVMSGDLIKIIKEGDESKYNKALAQIYSSLFKRI